MKSIEGSFLDKGALPEDGQAVFCVVGFDQKVVKGIVQKSTNIDNKGLANTYVDVIASDKTYHVAINQVYDHEPCKVVVEDEFGKLSVWK